jgi:hypothetical protein
MTTDSYESIRSQYAGYAVESDVTTKLKEVSESLKSRHVQPVPIAEVKRTILHAPSLDVIQTVLFTILLALVELLVVPTEYASYLVFITLCVGASAGIYLSTR